MAYPSLEKLYSPRLYWRCISPFIPSEIYSCNCTLQKLTFRTTTPFFLFVFYLVLNFSYNRLCISLVPLIFPYSAQILLENASFCRKNAFLKNRYSARNLSKHTPKLAQFGALICTLPTCENTFRGLIRIKSQIALRNFEFMIKLTH